MNRKIAIIIGLQTLLIIVLFWVLVFYGKDEYEAYTSEAGEEIETPNRVSTEQGSTIVRLSAEIQAQSDIRAVALQASKYQGSLSSFGQVVSIDPLIELRTRYLSARAEASVVRASVANSQQEYQRLLQLNQDNRNVSDRALAVAEAAWKADQAKISAAETTASNLRDNMRQLWGETLAAQAIEQPASAGFQRLLQYREVLLQITLPFDTATPKSGDVLTVSPIATQGKAIQAQFVSASPQTDNTVQGKTYFYRATSDELRSGMRVSIRMTESGKAATGVIVPASAVIWYGGKAWVYRKQDMDKFVRQPISTAAQTSDGWFNSGSLSPDDLVVVSGAQLLLSEEFKYQIKNENED